MIQPSLIRILVVVPATRLASTLAHLLSRADRVVTIAASAAEAREFARRERPHLVLVAAALRDQPRGELCRHLRSAAETAEAVLVVLGGKRGDWDALAAGADGCISIPASAAEWPGRLAVYLRLARTTASLANEREARLSRDPAGTPLTPLGPNGDSAPGSGATAEPQARRAVQLSEEAPAVSREREQRYETYFRQSHECIYCTEFDEPIDTSLPVEEQVDTIYRNAYMGECNQAMADAYGLPSPEAFRGLRLVEAHGGSQNPVNREVWRRFIAAGYRTVNSETEEVTPEGKRRYFRSNDTGIVVDGRLQRIWGTSADITEQVENRRRMAELSSFLEAVLDSLPAQLCVLDNAGEIVAVNRRWRDFAVENRMASPHAGVGMNYLAVCESATGEHSRGARWLAGELRRLLRGEIGEVSMEYPCHHPTARRWFTVEAVPLQGGGPRCAVLAHVEVTARKQSERELQVSETKYRTLVENSMDIVITLDRERHILAINRTPEGLHPSQVIGADVVGFVAPGDRAMVQAAIERVFATGAAEQYEAQARGAHDTLGWWETRLSRFFDIENRPRVLLVTREITPRKRAEAALEASERHYRLLAEHTEDFVTLFDAGWRRVYNSPSYQRRTGWTPLDLAQTDYRTRVHPDDLHVVTKVRAANEAGEVARFEYRVRCKDGSWMWMECVSKPLPGSDGARQVLLHGHEITERKETELTQSFLLRCGLPSSGEEFFAALARYLADTLGMEQVCIEQLDAECEFATPLAVYQDDQFLHPGARVVEGSPGAALIAQRQCCVLQGVSQAFPNDQLLRELAADGYVGTTLWDSRGRPNGLIAVAGRRPVANPRRAENLLNLVAPRAAAELELRAAETSRRESERSLREAQRLARIGNWEWDLRTDRHTWSPEIFHIYGRNQNLGAAAYPEVQGLFTPDSWATLAACVQRAKAEGEPYECDAELVRPDGPRRWVTARGEAVRDESRAIVALRGTLQDISERKAAEEELRRWGVELQQRVDARTKEIRDLYQNAPCGYHSLGPDGLVLAINDTELKWLGYTRGEVEGRMCFQGFLPPATVDHWQKRFQELKDNARSSSSEWEVRCKGGATLFLLVTAEAVRDEAGTFLRTRSTVLDITERKRLERSLAEKEDRLRRLFEASRDAILLTDLRGKCLDCNSRAVAMLGALDRTEILARGPVGFSPERQPDEALSAPRFVVHLAHAASQGTHICEWWFQRGDGTPLPVEIAFSYVELRGEKVLQCMVRDIAERRKAEAALRASEERYRMLFNQAVDAIYVLDDREQIVAANGEAARCLGYREEDLPRMTMAQIEWGRGPGRRRDRPRPTVEQPQVTFETLHTRKDGSRFPVEVSARLVPWQGRMAVMNICRDLTERHRAEAALRKLQSAVEQSPAAVVITDTEARIEYVNPCFTRQTGFTFEEVRGMNPRILSSGQHAQEFFSNMWRTLQAGEIWRGEICNRGKDGRLLWESTAIAPLRDRTGAITHYVAIKEDITERREILAQLKKALEDAESANRAKALFLASMSHEMRTPMHAILGFTRLVMESTELGEASRDRLGTVVRSGEHLLSVINDVLDATRLETGSASLKLAPFDLVALAEDVRRMIAPRAQPRQVRLTVELAAELTPDLVGDDTKLRQVFINLLGNAVKFTPAGGEVRLLLGTRLESATVVRLRAEVTDTGVGISESDLARLGEAFFQTQSGREAGGGAGLGLAITRGLLRLMGSELRVTSAVGTGTRFEFELLLAPAPEAAMRSTPAALSAPDAGDEEGVGGSGLEALRGLPPPLAKALQEATRRADFDELLALLAQVSQRDDRLARRMRRLVEDYNYSSLRELLSLAESADTK